MKLKEFIKQSIIDISEAIQESNNYVNENNIDAVVNPEFIYKVSGDGRSYTTNESNVDLRYLEDIDFDIAVTIEGEAKGEVSGGIKIASFHVGGGGSVSDTKQNTSRIKFKIPVALPIGKYKKSY